MSSQFKTTLQIMSSVPMEAMDKKWLSESVVREAIEKCRKHIANRTLPQGRYPDFEDVYTFLEKELDLDGEQKCQS